MKCLLLLIPILVFSCTSEKWIEFKSPENDYILQFPQMPSYSNENVDIGGTIIGIDFYSYTSQEQSPDNISYSISKTVYPDTILSLYGNDSDTFFDKYIDGSVRSVGGELISQREISIKGIPGREARVKHYNGRAIITTRLFLKGNTSYLVQTNTPIVNDLNAAQIKFLESFRLL